MFFAALASVVIAFCYAGDTRTFKQQIDNFKIFEVKPLRQRINQLLTREQHLISGLSNEPAVLAAKAGERRWATR